MLFYLSCIRLILENLKVLDARRSQEEDPGLSNEATQAIEAIEYITRHLTRDNDYKRVWL